VKLSEQKFDEAFKSAAKSEILLPEEPGYVQMILSHYFRYLQAEAPLERTYKFSQKQLKEAVDIQTASKVKYLFM
jgi:hypothetical protein